MLKGKHIILGVTGGIAAYKTAWLVREFVKEGADVQVVMTRSATEFITPLTLSTLSRRHAIIDMFPASTDSPVDQWKTHIDLALWADLFLIAPASANTIAKISHGLADNFLTTLVLAARCPLLVAPAMDVDMYHNATTQQNISSLRESGCFVIDPDSGELASGLFGPGRLPDLGRLLKFVEGILDGSQRDLSGREILITAGPTQEPIDPVRYIGNRSSGKMGFAIANAAALRGASVTLITGPVTLQTPRNVRRIDIQTAGEMQKAAELEFSGCDVLVMAAAVADYTPSTVFHQKLKREKQNDGIFNIGLRKNPDILKSLGSRKRANQILIGFALETENGPENAKKKLLEKNLDAIVLNNPTGEGAGFGSDTNAVTILTAGGENKQLPLLSKFEVANEILDRVVTMLNREKSATR
jgi:phosphopantothenoylcysteine decarboxylase/phosphopantothenate--cysteine ligase